MLVLCIFSFSLAQNNVVSMLILELNSSCTAFMIPIVFLASHFAAMKNSKLQLLSFRTIFFFALAFLSSVLENVFVMKVVEETFHHFCKRYVACGTNRFLCT